MTNRILGRLYGQPWEIRQNKLDELCDIAERRAADLAAVEASLRSKGLYEDGDPLPLELTAEYGAGRPEALQARQGKRLEYTRTVTLRDGVAIIPIEGPIFRKASWFSEISGATSTEVVARDFTTAAEDDTISAIVFSIDSPGGEAAGMTELSEIIYRARERKPVVAYVEMMAASAAYHIASAAERIVSSPMGLAGSIGCVLTLPVRRPSEYYRTFISAQSPYKQVGPETPEGTRQYQKIVNELAGVFVADVARNRGVSVEAVLADFGQGGIHTAEDARDAGMVDEVGVFEDVLQAARQDGISRARARTYSYPSSWGAAAGAPDFNPEAAATSADFSEVEPMADQNGQITAGQLIAAIFSMDARQKLSLRALLAEGDEAPTTPAAQQPAPAPPAREPAPESSALTEANNRARTAERRAFTVEASSFVKDQLRGRRSITAQSKALERLYVRCAVMDATEPAKEGEATALADLREIFANALPHGAYGNQTAPRDAVELEDRPETNEGDEKGELEAVGASTRAWAGKHIKVRADAK